MVKKIFANPLIILLLAVLSMVLHNLFYGLTKIEEPVFFTLTLIFAALFPVSLIYFIYRKLKKKN